MRSLQISKLFQKSGVLKRAYLYFNLWKSNISFHISSLENMNCLTQKNSQTCSPSFSYAGLLHHQLLFGIYFPSRPFHYASPYSILLHWISVFDLSLPTIFHFLPTVILCYPILEHFFNSYFHPLQKISNFPRRWEDVSEHLMFQEREIASRQPEE